MIIKAKRKGSIKWPKKSFMVLIFDRDFLWVVVESHLSNLILGKAKKKTQKCLLIPTLIEIKGKKEAIFQPSLFEWKMHSLPFLLLVFLSALPAPSAQKVFMLEKIGKMAQN